MSDNRYSTNHRNPEGEAVNADGTLKDAHEIEWVYDPDESTPIPAAPVTASTNHPLVCTTKTLPDDQRIDKKNIQDGEAVNADGTLKESHEITWVYDPDEPNPMSVGFSGNTEEVQTAPQARKSTPKQPHHSRARKKVRTDAVHAFLDIEAQVNDEEESEDETEADQANFIDNSEAQENLVHPAPRLNRNEDEDNPVIEGIMRRHVYKDVQADAGEDAKADTEEDAKDDAEANVGKEQKTVDRILRRIESGFCGLHEPPHAAFYRSSLPGRVFVQVKKIEDATFVCSGLNTQKIRYVYVETAKQYLIEREKPVEVPKSNTWIRLSSAPYKDDPAYVLEVNQVDSQRFSVVAVLLARLPYSTRKRKRGQARSERAPAARLNPDRCRAIYGDSFLTVKRSADTDEIECYNSRFKVPRRWRKIPVEYPFQHTAIERGEEGPSKEGGQEGEGRIHADGEEGRARLRDQREERQREEESGARVEEGSTSVGEQAQEGARGEEEKDAEDEDEDQEIENQDENQKGFMKFDAGGYLLAELVHGSYRPRAVHLSREEIMEFMDCPSIPDLAKSLALETAELEDLKRGDQVKLTEGDYRGMVGFVEQVFLTYARVTVTASNEIIEVAKSSLRRHFQIGDHVRVRSGEHAGAQGFVTAVNDEAHTVAISVRMRQVSEVFASINDVEFAEDDRVFVKPQEAAPQPEGQSASHANEKARRIHKMFEDIIVRSENQKRDKFLKMRVMFKSEPFRAYQGIIRTVSTQWIAHVEVEGVLVNRNQLVQRHLKGLYFFLDNDERLYEVTEESDFELVPTEHVKSELERRVLRPEASGSTARGRTPEPINTETDGVWAPATQQAEPAPVNIGGVIPHDHWLLRISDILPKNSSLMLKVTENPLRLDAAPWHGKTGVFKGVSDNMVRIYFQPSSPGAQGQTGVIPHGLVSWVPPTKKGCFVYVMRGSDFGSRHWVNEFGDTCGLGAVRGGHKYKVLKRIRKDDLGVTN
ncbi:hypothetical protein D9756_001537 [Leucocoprinus leucothites]|uniref:KOW domain-containing protein n=1 Tax=Leucocoprinus leucothites TaxID=201217 RepID=A0A8H5LI23_9AGAR|nr:hypothetical protein D9756_011535 [Leucoagaricus leucothites]KAF5357961.1 hypothetical protein D9756_001539 [Leucoagaricus leucothites]KAF5357967.1 hypothetical protein D9756_001537 [Leucoagaricus leucothites]